MIKSTARRPFWRNVSRVSPKHGTPLKDKLLRRQKEKNVHHLLAFEPMTFGLPVVLSYNHCPKWKKLRKANLAAPIFSE